MAPQTDSVKHSRRQAGVRFNAQTVHKRFADRHGPRLLDQRCGPLPSFDLAQAAPAYPPPPRWWSASVAAQDAYSGEYTRGAGTGSPACGLAEDLSRDYRSLISPEHIVVTAGCNQAFCQVIGAIACSGDEVIP